MARQPIRRSVLRCGNKNKAACMAATLFIPCFPFFPALSSFSYLSLFGLEIAHKSSRVWHPAQPSPFLNSQTSLLLCVDHIPTVQISSPPPPSPSTSTLEIIVRRGYMSVSVPCLEVEPSLGPPERSAEAEQQRERGVVLYLF